MALKIITLKNCDTCKKALKWLAQENIAHDNHDIRINGLDQAMASAVVAYLGWKTALNRRSTTWRNLDQTTKEDFNTPLDDEVHNAKAIALIIENPTLMKRPVLIKDDVYMAGFDIEKYQALLK